MKRILLMGIVLCAGAWAQSRIYVVCSKAGATPVVTLAEKKANGDIAVLSTSEGASSSCKDKSVHEVRTVETPSPSASPASGSSKDGPSGQEPRPNPPQPGGAPPPAAAATVGGIVPGGAIVSAAIKEALSSGTPIPVVEATSATLAPATKAAVSSVLKTKHDTAKNAIGNIR